MSSEKFFDIYFHEQIFVQIFVARGNADQVFLSFCQLYMVSMLILTQQ